MTLTADPFTIGPEPELQAAAVEPATPVQAAVYQQLRGHLAHLKLTAAAEALPSVLDTARAQGMTLTAAIEQLLR